MSEKEIVDCIVKHFTQQGFIVATEIANLYRSADIAIISDSNEIWIIECKISNISKAIEQIKTHKLSADKVFIGTVQRNTRQKTLDDINKAGIGIIYVNGLKKVSKIVENSENNTPWQPTKSKVYERIIKASK